MLLPFLLVLFAIPRTPRGRPSMYEWEYKRKDRGRFRAAMVQRDRMLRSMRTAYATSRLDRGSSDRSRPAAITGGPGGPDSTGVDGVADDRSPPATT
jgi:hypothetical protein